METENKEENSKEKLGTQKSCSKLIYTSYENKLAAVSRVLENLYSDKERWMVIYGYFRRINQEV